MTADRVRDPIRTATASDLEQLATVMAAGNRYSSPRSFVGPFALIAAVAVSLFGWALINWWAIGLVIVVLYALLLIAFAVVGRTYFGRELRRAMIHPDKTVWMLTSGRAVLVAKRVSPTHWKGSAFAALPRGQGHGPALLKQLCLCADGVGATVNITATNWTMVRYHTAFGFRPNFPLALTMTRSPGASSQAGPSPS